MNARRRLHDKWNEFHADNETSGDGSLMNDDDSDFVDGLVDETQQQIDSSDLQACLGHDGVQAMLMDEQVDSCGDLIAHHLNHHHHHLDHVPKDGSIRVQMSVPQLQHQLHQQHQQHHQQQLQHEHQQHAAYSLTSL
jgi:hypothetical protein